jgi:WD40 repeat protein
MWMISNRERVIRFLLASLTLSLLGTQLYGVMHFQIFPTPIDALFSTISSLDNVFLSYPDDVPEIVMSSDAKLLVKSNLGVQGADKGVQVWDLRDGVVKNTLPWIASAITFTPDQRYLVAIEVVPKIRVWDLKLQKISHTFAVGTSGLLLTRRLAVRSDSRILAATSLAHGGESLIVIWDLDTGAEVCANREPDVGFEALEFDPDKKILITSSRFEIKLWDATTCRLVRTISIERPRQANPDQNVSLTFRSDRQLLAGSVGNEINIWDTWTGKKVQVLIGHTASINTLLFSSDGKTLISSSYDKTIKIWDLQTSKVLKTILAQSAPGQSITFNQQKNVLVSASSDGTIRVWRIKI